MGREGVALTFVGDRDLSDLKRLLNANAIESIASAMEVSTIGGRNAARLAARHLALKTDRAAEASIYSFD